MARVHFQSQGVLVYVRQFGLSFEAHSPLAEASCFGTLEPLTSIFSKYSGAKSGKEERGQSNIPRKTSSIPRAKH